MARSTRVKTLIVGSGEVGGSLKNVLEEHYEIEVIDKDTVRSPLSYPPHFGIMHVCFPYSISFESEVKRYQKEYQPTYTVIHSTVPVGTNTKLGTISSPVVGIHPFLEQSLMTFTKYLGGEQASEVANYFRRVGMKVYLFDKPETPELMKLLDTTFYGICVEYTKEVKELTKKHGVSFESWSVWTENYNRGYQVLGYPEYTRPNLVPIKGKLGGHCVGNNATFLDSKFAKFLSDINSG